MILKQFSLPNLRVAATLLCLAFVYGACRAVGGVVYTVSRAGEVRWGLLPASSATARLLALRPPNPRASPPPTLPPPPDVWWVFLQPMITGGPSVMIDVATGGAPPLPVKELEHTCWAGGGLMPTLGLAAARLAAPNQLPTSHPADTPPCPAAPPLVLPPATGGSSREQLPMVLRVPHAPLGTNPAFSLLGLGECL